MICRPINLRTSVYATSRNDSWILLSLHWLGQEYLNWPRLRWRKFGPFHVISCHGRRTLTTIYSLQICPLVLEVNKTLALTVELHDSILPLFNQKCYHDWRDKSNSPGSPEHNIDGSSSSQASVLPLDINATSAVGQKSPTRDPLIRPVDVGLESKIIFFDFKTLRKWPWSPRYLWPYVSWDKSNSPGSPLIIHLLCRHQSFINPTCLK